MSFDFSTLVTDRTQADVNRVKQIAEKIKNGTASESELAEFNSAAMKGAYNYTDLNRVTEAMEALKAKMEGYGYAVPGYQKIEVPHHVTGGVVSMTNLVADGSFETAGTWVTWSADALVTEQSRFGSKSLKLTGDQLANVSVETPIVGHKYYGREYIKTDGEITIGDGRFEVHGGDGVGLNWVYGWNRGNYPNWTMQSAVHAIEVVNASSYVLRTFKVGGTGTVYVDGILLVDLTASFGAGFEPDKEWCDKYIPFFEGTHLVELPPRYEWKEYDAPTTGQMAVYLLNVSIIRSVLAVMGTTPSVPADMVGLMVKEANDIEVILLDVYRQINIMETTFIPTGEALSGGDNL